jgi:hypothetical protein
MLEHEAQDSQSDHYKKVEDDKKVKPVAPKPPAAAVPKKKVRSDNSFSSIDS